ncbi:hypothetical protein NVP1188A_85 [Vibrio phage 1.188.A._10N.286.51.A6]|uniref:Uncharacterized protein n=5 Tax=Mukerjeevirus TaxID=2733146 RepID=A0A2I7REJ0_9CAUD|nr:hypothetical protein HOU76_gp65 [Vibrio phage 1.169.O._10N.261.52.B1]YP_009817544.1 hypothetical protein HOU77_gp21 [Vibrio phage 1.188.A._10N.286.51.A6]YP_009817766.1 hypothetical protein HOU80_gp21 [Vibrio phage 1.261.O._10N.286.51.A7]AUR93739.1 hypothetical protein NVP1188B_85 [Vibrio phage 1.188.B._10N.286.51.A6]AUR93825.1 hypothetical protein NVP1188C_85 [Vibrio phage 1.188.C._10N.286.51.A6]AUR92062.1 hypothetical protein NVP1169O_34 [Vibrio phage 1.169.O._10N.261.52.B1]AUR93653.1 hyp
MHTFNRVTELEHALALAEFADNFVTKYTVEEQCAMDYEALKQAHLTRVLGKNWVIDKRSAPSAPPPASLLNRVTVGSREHEDNMVKFEAQYNVPSDFWTPEQGDLFEAFIVKKYNLFSFECYNVDTELDDCMTDYEADCLTLGHTF